MSLSQSYVTIAQAQRVNGVAVRVGGGSSAISPREVSAHKTTLGARGCRRRLLVMIKCQIIAKFGKRGVRINKKPPTFTCAPPPRMCANSSRRQGGFEPHHNPRDTLPAGL